MTQIMWLGVYVIVLLLIIFRWKQFTILATRNKLLLLLVIIALISILWSDVPERTIQHGISLVGTTLVGCYLAARYTLSEQLRLVAWALGIAALLSLLFAIALPLYGIETDFRGQEAVRGIYGKKNNLGGSMIIGTIVFFLLAVSSHRRRWLLWAGCILSFSLLLLSTSATAFVILLSFLSFWPIYKALRWRFDLAVPFLVIGVLLAGGAIIWLMSSAEFVLEILGRDITLTGRTGLWASIWDIIRERPWLGHGYSAFWLGWEGQGSSYVQLVNRTDAFVPGADNGYLDLGLGLGVLGVSVFVLGLLLALLRALVWARSTKTAEGFWPLIYLTFILLYNLTESALLKQTGFYWILYVAIVFSIYFPRIRANGPYYVSETTKQMASGRMPDLRPVARRTRW